MQLNKLLKNNTFLINSCTCLVLLLTVCYFGVNSPIKETYSADTYSLFGSYTWNEKITAMNLIYTDITYPLYFKDDDGNSYTSFKVLGKGMSGGYTFHYDSTLFAETDGSVFSDDKDTLIVNSEKYKTLYLDSNNNNVDSQFYEWFIANTTPNNKCYYNSVSKTYTWTNDFTAGVLYSELITKESCETENGKSLVVTFNVDGKIDDVTVKKGDSVELRNAVKDGYSFKGWYTEVTGGEKKGTFGESFTPTDNITLYAQFEANDINVDFGEYKVSGNYVYVDVDTTREEFEEKVEINETDGEIIYSSNLGTNLYTGLGFEISLADGRKDSYIIVVLGDVNGTGTIDSQDYAEIYNHFIEKNILSGIESMAADYSENGKIDSQDYAEIYNYFILMK